MKKKILSVIAAVASLSAIALVGCGGDEHTHKYVWKHEGEVHWQECEADGAKRKEGPHKDEKINATKEAGHDELCDDCGADLHKHDYVWKSTAAVHWQECKCGDKTSEEAHEDVKNNETGAAGADELCDDCGRGYYAVTFNLGGHGTVATQHIGKDGKVQEPEKPADDDSWKFKGWYKDEQHNTKFDFTTETITSATEIYAWFEDDETPGASKNHAYELELDVANPQKAQKGKAVYYSFKAAEEGRYTLSLGMGTNNENATFTTTKTGDTVYGLDCPAEEVAVDLDKNEKVYILFTFLGEEGDDVEVSPIVFETLDEALPAGIFKDGEYANDLYTVNLVTETKTMTVESDYSDPVTKIAKYIGGKYNTLTIIDETTEQTFVLTPNKDGTYTLKINSTSYVLNYIEEQDPVALGKLVGYYEPKGEAADGITELYIYSSDSQSGTSVLYKTENEYQVSYSDLTEATYDIEKNVLKVSSYKVRLKLGANGAVESLLVDGKEYVKKGELGVAPPAKLPLVNFDGEYTGLTHKIRIQYGAQYLGEGFDAITVMGYDEVNKKYTLYVVSNRVTNTYYVKVSDDRKTIELYEDGKTEPDTLSLFEREYHDLPTTADELELAAADYQKNLYVLVAQQNGWYNITATANAVVYYKLDAYSINNVSLDESRVAQGDIYLAEGDYVGVYLKTPAATTVTVALVTSPAGTTSENPKALVNGKATLDVVVDEEDENPQYAYFTYTAAEAGTYAVKATHGNMNSCLDSSVIVNDEEGFIGFYTPSINIELTTDLTVSIAVRLDSSWDYITVTVVEDVSINAVELTLEGTPENDVLTLTKNAVADVNYLVYTKGAPITVTGTAAFSVKLQDGTVVTAEESEDNSYVATIPAYVETEDGNTDSVCFRLVSDTEQTLTLTQTHAKGSQGYPLEIELTNGAAELEVATGDRKYFILTPGTYSLSSNVNQLRVILNEDDFLSFDTPFEVKEGDVLMCVLYSTGTATLTINEVVQVFTADQVGTYEGQGSVDFNDEVYDYDLKLTFNKYGIGKYWVDDQDYDIAIKDNKNGTYSFTYYDAFDVTFTFDNGVLKITDEDKSDDVVSMEKAKSTIGGRYTGLVADYDSEIIISDDGATVTYISGGDTLANNVTLVYDEDEDQYSFQYYAGTVTLTISGNTMEVDDAGLPGTLIKQD